MSTTAPELIASANTAGGFAIGVVRTATRAGSPIFEVVRMDRRSRYVTLTRHPAEAEARTAANAQYRAEMAALAR